MHRGSDMALPPGAAPPPQQHPESLEDRVHRLSLAEGERAVRGPGLRAAGPVALTLYALLAAAVALAGRRAVAGKAAPPSVAIVLQEGPEGGGGGHGGPPAGGRGGATGGPAPAAPRPGPGAPASPVREPVAAPAPVPAPDAPPPATPSVLPSEDHSRDVPAGGGGSGNGGAGTGPGSGSGPGTGSGSGSGSGSGTGSGTGAGAGSGAGGRGGPVVLLTFRQVRVKYQPPDPPYPELARAKGIQGTVVVSILVGLDGTPLDVRAQAGPVALRTRALEYARAWRFEPHLANGTPQEVQFTLNVNFHLTR